MTFDVFVSASKGWIQVRVRDEITRQMTIDFMTKAARAAANVGLNNFLFDMRHAENTKSPSHDYEIAHHHMRAMGFNGKSRLAILVKQRDSSHDFFVTTASNAGYHHCRVFEGLVAATDWLRPDRMPAHGVEDITDGDRTT